MNGDGFRFFVGFEGFSSVDGSSFTVPARKFECYQITPMRNPFLPPILSYI